MNDTNRNDADIIALNQQMLESVCQGNWETYRRYCHSDLTCFEAETAGHLVEGLDFHRFYFNEPADQSNPNPTAEAATVTMVRPHVRWLSDDAATISYTRLTQRTVNGEATTATCCETRIWQRRSNTWGLVHVHRS